MPIVRGVGEPHPVAPLAPEERIASLRPPCRGLQRRRILRSERSRFLDRPKDLKVRHFTPRRLVPLIVVICAALSVSVGAFLTVSGWEKDSLQAALEQGAAEQFGAL